jgi:hypothetical protein
MGVNLVPKIPLDSFRVVRDRIFRKNDPGDDHDLEDCAIAGVKYRLLKFEFQCHNIGDTDFVAGSPKTRPDIFVLSHGHNHYHLEGFNKYRLVDSSGKDAIPSLKQSFCIVDMIPPHPGAVPRFRKCKPETEIQGISAGWADTYGVGIPCQYIVLTGIIFEDGSLRNLDVQDDEYVLEAETNAIQEKGPFKGKRIFEEDNVDDNIVKIRLQISSTPPFVTVIG